MITVLGLVLGVAYATPARGQNDGPDEGATPTRRRAPRSRMFSAADDRAERARMRTPAGRRRAPGDPEVLELPGIPDAYFYRGGGARRSRVFVYLHPRNADPRESCRQFAPVVTRIGWLLCPVGPGIGADGRHQWNNNPILARQYTTTAVNTLFGRFPRRTRVTDNVLMGFSEGAFVAMQTGLNNPMMFPRWVIFAAHDRYIAGESAIFDAARRSVRKVYLLTGAGDEIVEHTRRAAAALRRERVGRVETQILPGVGHQLPPNFAPTVLRALRWVTR
jgi:predicted esterase